MRERIRPGRRLTFVVDAVDDVLDCLRAHGAELVGEVAQYGDIYQYCYVRGPDGPPHRRHVRRGRHGKLVACFVRVALSGAGIAACRSC
ncbi:hypothetical protein ACFRAO_07100 [Streptomyces sp. NPDC056656]|uniref:hypothetical protein n=1 Tax=Streptomyces sp. NPDC056656 TaxID=3345895 RepID=UPI00369DDF0D